MGFHELDTLRISPKFTSSRWAALNRARREDWRTAADIVKDRLDGRFLSYATEAIESPHSGFLVLAIDSLVMETIQQFRDGVIDGTGQCASLIERFLEGPRFQPEFNGNARTAYYRDIRCGLLHQAEARGLWLVRRDQKELLSLLAGPEGGYIIDVVKFHQRVQDSLQDYIDEIQAPASELLRENLWSKMDSICDVRRQRGAIMDGAVAN